MKLTRAIAAVWSAMLLLAAGMGAVAQAPPAAKPLAPLPPVNYTNSIAWLCLPGRADACTVDLSAMIVPGNGRPRLEEFTLPAREPQVDCFYVYPTVSRDPGMFSDMNPGPEERQVVQDEFARFSKGCRTFAPIYRQLTLTTLTAAMGQPGGVAALAATQSPTAGVPYADVLAAFRAYLANNNQGRGFVLIGHSQGAGLLKRLITEEIDGKPLQRQLVSAVLLGTDIQVPVGQKVGATFKSIPLCDHDGQTGCVIAYSSFRDTSPPPANALFGLPGSGTVDACVNPANLRGGKGEPESYFSTLPSSLSESLPNWTGDKWTPVGTPFVKTPGLVTTQCVTSPIGSYLAVHINADPRDPRTDDIAGDMVRGGAIDPSWGLHLIDMNLSMGDLVDQVARQGRNWRPPASR